MSFAMMMVLSDINHIFRYLLPGFHWDEIMSGLQIIPEPEIKFKLKKPIICRQHIKFLSGYLVLINRACSRFFRKWKIVSFLSQILLLLFHIMKLFLNMECLAIYQLIPVIRRSTGAEPKQSQDDG